MIIYIVLVHLEEQDEYRIFLELQHGQRISEKETSSRKWWLLNEYFVVKLGRGRPAEEHSRWSSYSGPAPRSIHLVILSPFHSRKQQLPRVEPRSDIFSVNSWKNRVQKNTRSDWATEAREAPRIGAFPRVWEKNRLWQKAHSQAILFVSLGWLILVESTYKPKQKDLKCSYVSKRYDGGPLPP
jgi:hypothetical protein